ncbi:MAG: 2-C-methyl-D-erythritol 2,4-cyclodiphosphate synthase [Firmicutes bacterium]|nr:2-C-methyl-D-erythritol 2,4-cyclodiphosphate synthase [Bacillota bacterium]
MAQFRIGHGYDVHRLVPERDLILGGVKIDYHLGLLGHSDADVLVHAIMDALLGAAGSGDIGHHFPDSSLKYKDISSLILLEAVKQHLDEKGFVAGNIDATIIAQKPKLASFIPEMKENIARVLGISPESVNIKATTTEGLGFSGRGEGIEAHAVCIITQNLPY